MDEDDQAIINLLLSKLYSRNAVDLEPTVSDIRNGVGYLISW